MNDRQRINDLKIDLWEQNVREFLLRSIKQNAFLDNADFNTNDDLLSWVECGVEMHLSNPNEFTMEELDEVCKSKPLYGILGAPNYNETIEFLKKYRLMPK